MCRGIISKQIDGNMSLQVTGNQMESVTGNKSLAVTGNQSESVTGNLSLAVTGQQQDTSMAYAMKTDTTIHLNAGVSAVIEAGVDLTLKVGSNFIDINPAGVFITGTMVFINSGGAAGSAPGRESAIARLAHRPEGSGYGRRWQQGNETELIGGIRFDFQEVIRDTPSTKGD